MKANVANKDLPKEAHDHGHSHGIEHVHDKAFDLSLIEKLSKN
jgi:hypothetical protein